ncbi:MAG: adenylate/guanylate cyclase domain-containing protein [Micromonosporaceae bacterium]|nr:adenylate/guanylate cyclase domain-containing protein [Micromonosporaceae bacterium]
MTFLFTDIEGSTRLAHLLGDDYRSVLHEHRSVLRRAFIAADGAELFTEGDALFVAFPDAARALLACAWAQRELQAHPWRFPEARPKVRMGLHSGVVTPVAGEYTSQEVHRAARVAAAAHGDQILCSAATARLAVRDTEFPGQAQLRDLGLHRLRGFDGRERLFQLLAAGLADGFPRPRTGGAPPHNLPAHPGRFIGRCLERVEVRRLLAAQRSVTVVGPGGAGKTRLAVEVARTLTERYADGVWFADLGTVTEPSQVPTTVAAALGLRSEPGRPVIETIADHVADRDLLLVLDTCDAWPGAARELVDRVLAAGARVAVLATSREPNRTAGEVVWRIPQMRLDVPSVGGYSDAVALLVDRACAARGGRNPSPAEIADFERIVTALGGLPLALELAAARLRVLSSAQLAARLGDLFGVLDAGSGRWAAGEDGARSAAGRSRGIGADRHQTMRAAIAWSYETLRPGEALLLRRLSVFAGPVDLAAVEWLHGEDPLGHLATLVDKSLIQAEPARSGATYRMLGPIRAFAARQLVEAGEESAARDCHVDWCLRGLTAGGEGTSAAGSLCRLDPIAEEIRTALEWTATRGSVRNGLFLATLLHAWWCERGLAGEGRRWLSRLCDRIRTSGQAVPPAAVAEAYRVQALLAGAEGEHAEELRWSKQAENLARRCGDPALVARTLASRCTAMIRSGRFGEAERTCLEAIALARRYEVQPEALAAVYTLAELFWRRGALDRAADLLALARPDEAAHPAYRGCRTVDMLLGLVALSRGDLVAAHEYLLVALRSRIGHGFQVRACETLNAIAVRCVLGGDHEMAARLFGAAQAGRGRLRSGRGTFGAFWADHYGMVRDTLGDGAFDAAYAEGGELSLDEAVALALGIEHPDLVAGAVRF